MWLTGETEMDADGMYVNLVEGGVGFGAWLARIVGTDDKYGFKRVFEDSDRSRVSKSGMRGTIRIPFASGDGLFQYGKISKRNNVSDRRSITSGFVIRANGAVWRVSEKVTEKIAKILDPRADAFADAEFRPAAPPMEAAS